MVDIADQQKGEDLAKDLSNQGPGKAAFVHADLTDMLQVKTSLNKAKDLFGSVATIVCNNAGISIHDSDPRLKTMLDLNVSSVIFGTQIAADLLLAAKKKGCIVNTASLAGILPIPDTPAYAASKWAVLGYTLSCRKMLKTHGARVNCVCPALVDTKGVGEFFKGVFSETKMGRALIGQALQPRHVAEAILGIIQNDKLHTKAVVVAANKTYIHKWNFRAHATQSFDAKVPAFVERSKL